MQTFRYILEPYKGKNTRYHCPGCNSKVKTFTRYIDTEMNNQHIAPTVGKCDRESNCSYHYTPKQFFDDNNISFDTPQHKKNPVIKVARIPEQKTVSFIPVKVFQQSRMNYERNNFVKFLTGLFGVTIAGQLVNRYFIGTSKYWPGATVFYQVDITGIVRTGKIMLYNPDTGKRVKEPFPHIQWVHKALKLPDFKLKQCLFGEHILNNDLISPVAIVESEKTAIIASKFLPQFIWLACGSATGLTPEKCIVLKGRKVVLYPDLNCYKAWSKKAKELSRIAHFSVSELLEQKASEAERKQGLDIADYLLKPS